MNIYTLSNLARYLPADYIIYNKMRNLQKKDQALSEKYRQITFQADIINRDIMRIRSQARGHIVEFINQCQLKQGILQCHRSDLITKLKSLRKIHSQYNSKTRNSKIYIPDPDQLLSTYVEVPAQITELQLELDRITKKIGNLIHQQNTCRQMNYNGYCHQYRV